MKEYYIILFMIPFGVGQVMFVYFHPSKEPDMHKKIK